MRGGRAGRLASLAAATLGRVLLLLCWSVAGSLSLTLPPLLGVPLLLGLLLSFLCLFAVRPLRLRQRRKLARLQLRPLAPEAWRWLWLAVPAMLLFNAGFLAVYLPLAGEPPQNPVWLEQVVERPVGWLLAGILILLSAPLIEEFVFRGWILNYWKRPIGPTASLLLAAFLFGCIHLSPYTLLFHTGIGLFLGAAVLAARSLWAGVFLHALHNACTPLLAPVFLHAEGMAPTGQVLGLVAMAAGAAAFRWLCGRLRDERAKQRRALVVARGLPA